MFFRPTVLAALAVSFPLQAEELRVAFKTEGRGTRYGDLTFTGDRISIRIDDAESLSLAPGELESAEFHSPKHDPARAREAPAQKGDLPAPWKHATVGRLRARVSAHADGSTTFHVFTSAAPEGEAFRSFSMAYREAPENGHITARVTHIGHGDHESRAGIIIRDGLDKDSGNFMLVVHPGQGASFHAWRNISSGYSAGEFGSRIRVPYWVRLVRDAGTITALISPDGRSWTLIREIEESVILGEPRKDEKEKRLFGLAATSSASEKPFAATFDNVSLGPLEDVARTTETAPRIHLTDGSKIQAPATSNEDGKLIQIGPPWNRNLPALYVARIDFFHPLVSDKERRLASLRPGVLLAGGDFIESTYISLHQGKLNVLSPLLGARTYEAGPTADAVVLREPDPKPGRRSHFEVETLDGQILFAKDIKVSAGKFVFTSPFLGEASYSPAELKKFTTLD